MRIYVGLCALLGKVNEVIVQKPAAKVNRRQQSQRINDKFFFYNIYASEAKPLDLYYLHIRA